MAWRAEALGINPEIVLAFAESANRILVIDLGGPEINR
jgi:hypothetical protein